MIDYNQKPQEGQTLSFYRQYFVRDNDAKITIINDYS